MRWPLLDSLSEEEARALLATTQLRRFGRGEVIVHEGDPSDSLHFVESGRLAVQVTAADGESAILNVIGPGGYFGELSLIDQRPPTRTATIFALERAETRSLSATAFRDLRQRHSAVGQLLLALMARRVEELSARVLESMYAGLDHRVHRRLVELAEAYADGRPPPIVVPLTQEQVAQMVGGTRPSVNQVLQRLAARGVVGLSRGQIVVHDPGWLVDHSS